jgi:hypothetical protein
MTTFKNTAAPAVSIPANLDQLALEIARSIDTAAAPTLLSPALFIDNAIRTMVLRSSADSEVKSRIDANRLITVEYREPYIPSPGDWLGSRPNIPPLKHVEFALNEIVTDFFRHQLKDANGVRIRWPDEFPADLRQMFEDINLQAVYKAELEDHFNRPNVKDLAILLNQRNLDSKIRRYLKRPTLQPSYKALAEAYLNKSIAPRLVEFNVETRVNLNQAVFLTTRDQDYAGAVGGLLVFLDERHQDAIYEMPQSAEECRTLIEGDVNLRRKVLNCIALYHRLNDGNQTLNYHTSINRLNGTVLVTPSLRFPLAPDIGEALFALSRERMLSDIDTLISTDEERLADQLLEIGGYLLSGLSLGVVLPTGAALLPVRLLISFLLGLTSSALDGARGYLADLPEEAQALYRAALIGAASEVIIPLGQKLLGKTLSSVARTRLVRKVKAHLRIDRGHSTGLSRIPRAPSVTRKLEHRLNAKLRKGPQAAQRIVHGREKYLTRFIEPHDIMVYRGFVFRGDMRNPELVFKQGFKLRTSAADIQKDIHQVTGVRGGFGGGRDALDPDGKGISTSVFYNKDNVGAFTYGGAKGGHTYLIDARNLDGYHLYANDFAARHPNAPPLKMAPLEINYANDIAPSAIIGAYDKNGVFIANTSGLRRTARIDEMRLQRRQVRRTARKAGKNTLIDKDNSDPKENPITQD